MVKEIRFRADYEENWEQANPVLSNQEIGISVDEQKVKIGDGKQSWNKLTMVDSKRLVVESIFYDYTGFYLGNHNGREIPLRIDSTKNWEKANPILSRGEIGVDENKMNIKVGNGDKAWNDLTYF